jgi:prevent-host-death family protein
LSALLERVAKGETITITKHGVPVAKLVPVGDEKPKRNVKLVIEELLEFRKRNTLGDLSIRKMIEEGRH